MMDLPVSHSYINCIAIDDRPQPPPSTDAGDPTSPLCIGGYGASLGCQKTLQHNILRVFPKSDFIHI